MLAQTTVCDIFEGERKWMEFCYVGKNIWAIDIAAKTTEMYKQDESDKWERIYWKNQDFGGLGSLLMHTHEISVVNNLIYISILRRTAQSRCRLFEFDTETLIWRQVADIWASTLLNSLVLNNKMYQYINPRQMTIKCLDTEQIAYVNFPPIENLRREFNEIININGLIYTISLTWDGTRIVFMYNDQAGEMIEISRTTDPELGIRGNRTPSAYMRENLWSCNNRIYHALVFYYHQAVRIDCYDIQTDQWSIVCCAEFFGRGVRSIFGTEKEIHVMYSGTDCVKHQIIDLRPTLEHLALTQLIDNTESDDYDNVVNRVPASLRDHFKYLYEWRQKVLRCGPVQRL